MFDQMKNLSALTGLLKNSGEIQKQFQEMQEDMKRLEIEAETGGGAVRAVVSGAMRVKRIEIDPAMFGSLVDSTNPDDRALGSELIAGAVNAALEKAQRTVADEMARRAQDLNLPLPPGMDLNSLLG